MAFYRVEIGYKTKRGGVCVGMTVEAFDQEEAEDIAREHIIDSYPARKWVFTTIEEADATAMKMGVLRKGTNA